eukprot:1157375-Pelagomonas_calceolata.AAC.1
MPKDKGSEWDYVTVAEPDEANGESKAKSECLQCCAFTRASCAITNLPQTWCGCTATCTCSSAPRTCSSWGRLRLGWLWRMRRRRWGRRRGPMGGKTDSQVMQSRNWGTACPNGWREAAKLETRGPGRACEAPPADIFLYVWQTAILSKRV